MTIHIHYTPMREIHREPLGERYCFHERKRKDFFYTVAETIERSYYDPSPAVRCGSCNEIDADLFPGYTRDWDY